MSVMQHHEILTVLLTDLYARASVYTLKRNEDSTVSVVIYDDLSVGQGLCFVVDHILTSCVTTKRYTLPEPEEGERDSITTLRSFKKSRVSPESDCVEWDHFQEMLNDTDLGSRERAAVINQMYSFCDLPRPVYINSMYA